MGEGGRGEGGICKEKLTLDPQILLRASNKSLLTRCSISKHQYSPAILDQLKYVALQRHH